MISASLPYRFDALAQMSFCTRGVISVLLPYRSSLDLSPYRSDELVRDVYLHERSLVEVVDGSQEAGPDVDFVLRDRDLHFRVVEVVTHLKRAQATGSLSSLVVVAVFVVAAVVVTIFCCCCYCRFCFYRCCCDHSRH